MSLLGNVANISLEEVFGFLMENELQGELAVRNGASSFRLYFEDGRIFLPHSDREGIRSLSKVLEPDGVVARAWKGLVTELRKRSDRWRRISSEESETRRQRYTEEIHSMFLWDEAHFEFVPGELTGDVQSDLESGRGVFLEPQAILFEVARRTDERLRIRRAIPSGRVFLVAAEGRADEVSEAMEAVDVELDRDPIDGTQPLDVLLRRWLAPQYDVLAAVASLVEAGAVQPLDADRARQRFRVLLDADDLHGAAQVLEHLSEIEATPPGQVLDLEPALVNSKAFRKGKKVVCKLRLDGPRVFALVRELLDASTPFALALQHGKVTKRVSLVPGVLTVSAEPPTDVPPLQHYLARITKKPLEEIEDLLLTHGTFAGVISAPLLEQAVQEKVVDELAEVVFWPKADVELGNRGVKSDDAKALVLPLASGVSSRVRHGLVHWAGIFADVPGEDTLFVASPKCKPEDPAGRFFSQFGVSRNIGEMRRPAGAGKLQFTKLVDQGYKNGFLLRPTERVLRAWIESMRSRDNHIMTYRFLRAAVAFGHEDAFRELLDEYRGKDLLPSPDPALQGRLAGVGIPGVLQSLRKHRHTGTLTVTRSGGDKEQVYFDGGHLFLLHREPSADQEFLDMMLGDMDAEHVSGLVTAEEVDEGQLDQALVRRLKDSFLEVLFWEDASFAFHENDLPPDFFTPSRLVTKIALRTNEFLLEAIRVLDEWDAIRRYVPGDETVLRFVGTEDKLRAIQDHEDCADALMLIDGRLSFGDLIRRTGEARLVIGRAVASLVEDGYLDFG